MRGPSQGAIGGWVMLGLYYSGFLFVSCHFLIPPRVSSLIVQGLGFSTPTPKAQGLISAWALLSAVSFSTLPVPPLAPPPSLFASLFSEVVKVG